MRQALRQFWAWYERYYVLNVTIATLLFVVQLIHLYWLTTDVVIARLLGQAVPTPTTFHEYLLILVDYTEIPALITTSILYLSELRKQFSLKHLTFLIFLNVQWLHLFWITDEFVLARFATTEMTTLLPFWLAWVAIAIDYLELPVIYDTLKRFFAAIRGRQLTEAFEVIRKI